MPAVAWIVLAGTILLSAPLAGQDVDRTPPPDPLTEALWSAAALQQILSERDYPALLGMALLNRSESAAGTLVTTLESAAGAPLDRCRGLENPVEGTLCSLEVLVPLLPQAEGRELADEGARLLEAYLRPGEGIAPGMAGLPAPGSRGGEGGRLAPLQLFAQGVVEESLRRYLPGQGGLAPSDRLDEEGDEAAVGRDPFAFALESLIGFTPEDGASGILDQVPELRSLLLAHPGVASLEESVGSTLQATLLDGESILAEYRSFLTSLTGSPRSLLDSHLVPALLGGEPGTEDGTAVSLADWATQRSFVYLASRTASLAGVETGITQRIQTLGNAAADLRQEGYAFRSNLTSVGRQMAMGALSGNVFTLASGMATFFQMNPGALGPGAAEEVRALRGLVEDLRGEMSEGFEGVDVRFDEVMETLDDGFARMETLVAGGQRAVLGELSALSREFAELGGRVDRLDANLVAYLQAGFDRDYTRTLIRCLEHRERHLPPFDQMEFPVFSECLTEFRARGARDARDALLTDRTTPVDDESLAEALSDDSPTNLARRLPLLARAAEQRLGDTGMRGGRGGANPLEWAIASQAYLTMLQDWPEHAAGVSTGDLEALLATGLETRSILAGIEGVMHRVLADYEEGVSDLIEESDLLARRYQQAQLRRVDPSAFLNRMIPEDPDLATLAPPRRIAASIPPEVRTAAVLALEQPALVYRTVTTDSISTENERRRWILFGKRHDRLVHARTRMEVDLRIGEGEVVARHRAEGPMVLLRIEEMAGAEGSDQVRSVDERISDPGRHFVEEVFPQLTGIAGNWEASPPDPAVLRRLGNAIEEELRRYESASLNRVFGSVCSDDPIDSLLEGPDRASAERIRASVERMTTARLLLGSFVRLALPESAAEDPLIREALFSEDGLLDRSALCGVVAAGESPLRVVWLEEEPRQRAARLSRALTDAIEREEAEGGAGSMIDVTIQQLRAAIRLQAVRSDVAR